MAKGRATGISAPNLYQRNKETDPEEAMTTYGVFIASADKWNENTPMNTVHQGEHPSEHMLLQKEPPSLMSMTFDSESISRFRTRMSQSQLPWIRHLARIDCLSEDANSGHRHLSHSDEHAVGQPEHGKPAVVPLSQVVFDPGIALKCSQAARQSRFGFFRYLARTCIPPEMIRRSHEPHCIQ